MELRNVDTQFIDELTEDKILCLVTRYHDILAVAGCHRQSPHSITQPLVRSLPSPEAKTQNRKIRHSWRATLRGGQASSFVLEDSPILRHICTARPPPTPVVRRGMRLVLCPIPQSRRPLEGHASGEAVSRK